MLCLTDARRKGDYDASLGRMDTSDGKRRTFEQILLATKVVDQAALDKARNFAKAINVEVRDALVQQRLAKYDAVLPAYAEAVGLPYLDLRDIPLNKTLISQVPPQIARQHSCVPVMVDDKQLLMASPNPLDPNVEEELRLRFNMPVRIVLCSPANIDEVLAKYVPRDGSAPAPPPPAEAEPTATAAAAPAAAAPAPAAPATEDAKKQQRDQAAIAFVITSWVSMGALKFGLGFGWGTATLITAVVAAAVGGTVWKIKSR